MEQKWRAYLYRGSNLPERPYWGLSEVEDNMENYPEDDDNYLEECLENLQQKGIEIQLEDVK